MGLFERLWRMWKPPCPRCDQQSGSCVETHFVGSFRRQVPAIRVHQGARHLHACLTALGHESAPPRATCRSCAAPAAGFHHESCVEETCPHCGGHVYWCECLGREPGPARSTALSRLGAALEWLRIAIAIEGMPADEQRAYLEEVSIEGPLELPESLEPPRPEPVGPTEIEACEARVKRDPTDIDAWLALGSYTHEGHHAERSLRCFERALEIDPDRVEAWLGKARVLNNQKRPLQALVASDRAIALAPELATGWFERAMSLHGLERFADAVDAIEQATQLDPSARLAWKMREVCQQKARRARVEMGVARSPGPPRPPALARTAAQLVDQHAIAAAAAELAVEAGAALDRGDLDGAVERLRQVNQEAPGFAWAWRARARCAHVAHRFDEAVAGFQTAFDLDGRADDLEGLGSCQLALGDIDAALASLDQAVELAPNLADAWHSRSLAREAAGDEGGARADFERYLELAAGAATGRADRAAERHAEARQRLDAGARDRLNAK